MNLDPGTIVIVGAVLVFYLRLIILQQQRVRGLAKIAQESEKKKGKKKNVEPARTDMRQYSILSRNRRDWIIAGAGGLAILMGVILKTSLFAASPITAYWWVPLAVGIIAFSWAFQL